MLRENVRKEKPLKKQTVKDAKAYNRTHTLSDLSVVRIWFLMAPSEGGFVSIVTWADGGLAWWETDTVPCLLSISTWTERHISGLCHSEHCPLTLRCLLLKCQEKYNHDHHHHHSNNNNSNLHLFGAYCFPGTILSSTMSFDLHKNNFEVGTVIISNYHMGKPRLGKVMTPF